MRIDRTQMPQFRPEPARATARGRASVEDAVTLSPIARSAVGDTAPSGDASEVTLSRLRREVASGTYEVDVGRLAQRMLEVELGWGE